jgi:multiple sugar transport system ATP-binding protein
LDARLRVNVRLELKRLHRETGGTILYVTHDQVEAMTLGDKVVVMREGRVHQIDSPEMIYDRPADTFVATFIGSPEMNLFGGRLGREKGRFVFHGPGFILDLGDVVLDLQEGDVEIGLRPEDIEFGKGSGNILKGKVELSSNVGAEKYIHLRLDSTGLTVRAPKDTSFEPGETVGLAIDPSRLHFFQNGLRLKHSIRSEDGKRRVQTLGSGETSSLLME